MPVRCYGREKFVSRSRSTQCISWSLFASYSYSFQCLHFQAPSLWMFKVKRKKNKQLIHDELRTCPLSDYQSVMILVSCTASLLWRWKENHKIVYVEVIKEYCNTRIIRTIFSFLAMFLKRLICCFQRYVAFQTIMDLRLCDSRLLMLKVCMEPWYLIILVGLDCFFSIPWGLECKFELSFFCFVCLIDGSCHVNSCILKWSLSNGE